SLTNDENDLVTGPLLVEAGLADVENAEWDSETLSLLLLDNETVSVSLSLSSASFNEAGSPNSALLYAYWLNAPSGDDNHGLLVPLHFSGDGALLGEDYTAEELVENAILIPEGETVGTVTLTGVSDGLFEGNESFTIQLDSGSYWFGNAVSGTVI